VIGVYPYPLLVELDRAILTRISVLGQFQYLTHQHPFINYTQTASGEEGQLYQ